MILLLAVLAGLLAGLARAWLHRRSLHVPDLKWVWGLLLAGLVQAVAFQFPATRSRFPEQWGPVLLVGTQVVLFAFVWVNRKHAGFWALGLGLAANLLVISLNGGWMPISPDTVRQLVPNAPRSIFQAGHRFGSSKDWVIDRSVTPLAWLSDRWVTPDWFPIHAAFSFGDVLIGLGAFLFLWSIGAPTGNTNVTH
ncbi:MAG: DUF5317 domain-containing protein [Anaerolineaceae bacterium]|nr:DUF5317 domain-containing protein [Anaerolineaceae bacterium]